MVTSTLSSAVGLTLGGESDSFAALKSLDELWRLWLHLACWQTDRYRDLPADDVDTFDAIAKSGQVFEYVEDRKMDCLRAGLVLPDHWINCFAARHFSLFQPLSEADRDRLEVILDEAWPALMRLRAMHPPTVAVDTLADLACIQAAETASGAVETVVEAEGDEATIDSTGDGPATAETIKGGARSVNYFGIARAKKGWKLYRKFNGRWDDRGSLNLIEGRETELCELFRNHKGEEAVTRDELVKAFRETGKSSGEIMASVVTPTLTKVRRKIRQAIANVYKCASSEIDDPLPRSKLTGTWRCLCELGEAVADDEGNQQFWPWGVEPEPYLK